MLLEKKNSKRVPCAGDGVVVKDVIVTVKVQSVGPVGTAGADELAVMLRAFVELDSLDGIVLSSVVPQLIREYELLADRWAGADLIVVGPGVSTGMPVLNVDPRQAMRA